MIIAKLTIETRATIGVREAHAHTNDKYESGRSEKSYRIGINNPDCDNSCNLRPRLVHSTSCDRYSGKGKKG